MKIGTKSFLVIGLTLLLIAAFTVPAFAVTTQVQVTSSGISPEVKCKWETPDDGDPTHVIPGTQVLPVPGYVDPSTGPVVGCKEVKYWAVVTSELGMGSISGVYADVFHPEVLKQVNLTGEADPSGEWCGSHKYQVQLDCYMKDDNAAQVAAFQSAVDQNLVTFGVGFDAADVIEELLQGQAELFMGIEYLCDHQPAGVYHVEVSAASGSSWSPIVENDMTFMELKSYLIDFSGINYGQVAVNVHKLIGGDWTMQSPIGINPATIWNNGNVYLNILVGQNDANFGFRTVGGQKVWNVHWDARLGHERPGATVFYDPNNDHPTQLSLIPGLLVMCTPTKVDFSICVDKAPNGSGTYSGTLILDSVKVPFQPCEETPPPNP